MKLLILCALLVGCTHRPPLESLDYKYTVECIHIQSEIPLDLDAVQFDTNLARSLLDREGILKARDFCSLLFMTSFTVHREYFWTPPDGKPLAGLVDISGIYLGKDMRSLLHEVLHYNDVAHLSPGTRWHENWDTNGYDDLDLEYLKSFHPTNLDRE